MRRFLAVGGGALLAFAIAAAPAAGAVRWAPAAEIAIGNSTLDLSVLADRTAIAVITEHHPQQTGDHDWEDHAEVKAAVRPTGGVFGAPVTLTGRDNFSGGLLTNFGSDAALLIWHDDPLPGAELRLMPRPAGAGFQPIETLPEGAAGGRFLGPGGDLTMVLRQQDGTPVVVTRRADGSYTQPRPINGTPDYAGDLIIEPNGFTTVLWDEGDHGEDIYSTTAGPVGPFAPRQTIARSQYSARPSRQLAQDARGNAILAWNGGPVADSFRPGTLHVAFRPAGGRWSAPQTIPGDPLTQGVSYIDLAMNARGDAVLGWGFFFGGGALSYRPAGGAWERTVSIPDEGNDRSPVVGIGANGDAIAISQPPDTGELVSYDHPAGGGWQPGEPMAESGEVGSDPCVGVDPDGQATALWRAYVREGQYGIRAATHEITVAPPKADAPPKLADLELRGPHKVAYRVSEKGRVEFALRTGKSKRVVAGFRVNAAKGRNTTRIPDRVRKRLHAGQRYRATLVAVDRYEQYSKPHTVVFETGG